MAERLFGITADQATRIGRVLDNAEHRGPQPQNLNSGKHDITGTFWAELTGEGTAGHYSWKLKYPKQPADGTYEDPDTPYVVAAFTARAMNLTPGLTGKIVKLTFIGYDAGGEASYEFAAGGDPLLHATANTAWTSGNTITATPCVSATDATPTGDPNVIITLFSPARGVPINVQIQAGDIIAYLPTGTDELFNPTGIAVNVNFGTFTTLGTAKYQVYQMTSNSVAGWDWVRAHG